MKIGDRVLNKKCGPPISGAVVGIARADFIQSYSGLQPKQSWVENYPDYLNKNLIYVLSDSPVKELSLDEFLSISEKLELNTAGLMYKLLPANQLVILPEEDVELL